MIRKLSSQIATICCEETRMVSKFHEKMFKKFNYMEGAMKKFGCKMVCNQAERTLKKMQPVLIQSFQDEFKTPGGHHSVRPTVLRSMLMRCNQKSKLT